MPAAADPKKKKAVALPPKPALYTDEEWSLAHSVPRLLELLSGSDKGSTAAAGAVCTKPTVSVLAGCMMMMPQGPVCTCSYTWHVIDSALRNSSCAQHCCSRVRPLCCGATVWEALGSRLMFQLSSQRSSSCCGPMLSTQQPTMGCPPRRLHCGWRTCLRPVLMQRRRRVRPRQQR